MNEQPTPWSDACLAARVLAAGGNLGGIHVRARAGPVLDLWLEHLCAALDPSLPYLRISAATPESRLVGGLDVAASLQRGAPVGDPGLLAKAHGGILVLSMAERATPTCAGIIGAALDSGVVLSEGHGVSRRDAARFQLIALDEGVDDECIPPALADRLGLRIDLSAVPYSYARSATIETSSPSGTIGQVEISEAMLEAIAAASLQAGATSMRAAIWLTRAARALAALNGVQSVEAPHVATAMRLVLGAGVTQPAEAEPSEERDGSAASRPDEAPAAEPADADAATLDPETLRDMLIEPTSTPGAHVTGLPVPGAERARGAAAAGKSGAVRDKSRRGRPAGLTARPPFPDARPNVVATLRAAAPWQKLRRRERAVQPGRVAVRKSDFRYIRYRHQVRSTAIFVVDASGSTAVERLGEAKGAVELLLADCYVRRDSVAVVAFRGLEADVIVEPTRSLVRAKRLLTGLPGGGPTPLASGLAKGIELAAHVRRADQSPLLVLLTDGNGNVALDGSVDRQAARHDADVLARHAATLNVPALLIDIARRPRDTARDLATTMRADYQQLPRADAVAVSGLVAGYMR